MFFLEPIFWLAMNIYHEARGEQLAGQVAVGHVVLNRAERQGKPVKDIVLAPYQFSWANGNARPSVNDYDSMLESFEAAAIVLNERLEGKTLGGADHYHAITMSKFPTWVKGMTVVKTIGNHRFYRS